MNRLRIRLWRLGLRTRFVLFQRGRHDRLSLERVAGLPILVLPGVFNPALFFSSGLLAAALDPRTVPPGARVLDVGTGSGVLAVVAASLGARVTAIDSNPDAVRCARLNSILNDCEDRVLVRGGDIFGAVDGERFDVVLCNPPFYPGGARDARDAAWRAGDFPERFAAGLAPHLVERGCALVVLSDVGDEAAFLAAARANGFLIEPVRRRAMVGEVLTVYRLSATGG